MQTPPGRPSVPVHPFKGNGTAGFMLARSEGSTVSEPDMLRPHCKAYYLLVFVRQNQGRHWADLTPYEHRPNTVYFSEPGQILIKEEPRPFWGAHLQVTPEFLARHAGLGELPIIQNPRRGHELRLTAAEADTVEALLAQLEAECQHPGK